MPIESNPTRWEDLNTAWPDGTVDEVPQVGDRPDMIFVAVGQDDRREGADFGAHRLDDAGTQFQLAAVHGPTAAFQGIAF